MNQAVAVKKEQQLSMPIRDYAQFYQFYLTEHSNVISRRLHVAGSAAGIYCVYKAIKTGKKSCLLKGLLTGYACAWVGHFFFEKNKPATFKYPLYSLVSDFLLFWDLLNGKQSFRVK